MHEIELRSLVAVNTRSSDPQDDYRWVLFDEKLRLFNEMEKFSRYFLDIEQGELPSVIFLSSGKFEALMVLSLPTTRRDHVGRRITNTLYLEEEAVEHSKLLMLLAQLLVDHEKRLFHILTEYSEEVRESATRASSGVRNVPPLYFSAQEFEGMESGVDQLGSWRGHRLAVRSTRRQHGSLAAYLASHDMRAGSFGLVLSGMVNPSSFIDAGLKLPDSFWILTSSPDVTESAPVELQQEARSGQLNPLLTGMEDLFVGAGRLLSGLKGETSDSEEAVSDRRNVRRLVARVRRHLGSGFRGEILKNGENVAIDPSEKKITLSLSFTTAMNRDRKPKIRIANTDHRLSGDWKDSQKFKGTLDLGEVGIRERDSVHLEILGAISQDGHEMESWTCTLVVGSTPQNPSR